MWHGRLSKSVRQLDAIESASYLHQKSFIQIVYWKNIDRGAKMRGRQNINKSSLLVLHTAKYRVPRSKKSSLTNIPIKDFKDPSDAYEDRLTIHLTFNTTEQLQQPWRCIYFLALAPCPSYLLRYAISSIVTSSPTNIVTNHNLILSGF